MTGAAPAGARDGLRPDPAAGPRTGSLRSAFRGPMRSGHTVWAQEMVIVQQWNVMLARRDSPIPGRETRPIEGPRLRQFVSAIIGHHNGDGSSSPWSPVRIAGFAMPTPDSPGSLSLIWLRRGAPPSMGVVGDVRAVGDAVLEVTAIDSVETRSLGELSAEPGETEAEFRTLTPVRLTRRIGEKDVDVLVPREELIMNGLIRDWIAIAEDDDSAPPMTDEVARHLIGHVVLSGHHGLHVVNRVVKRDSRTGAPHQRRAFTGAWRLRLVAGTDEQRRRFAATMRLARITGIGRDHTIGGGRVLVELPPRSPDRSNPQRRTGPAAPTTPTRTAMNEVSE